MTRRRWSSEEKIRIVLESLNTNIGIAELCRKHSVSPVVFYRWREMVLLYRKNKKLFLKMYHRRSLAESVVSAVKRRFDHRLVSRKRSYQKKEVMLKVITYNLSIVARTTVKA